MVVGPAHNLFLHVLLDVAGSLVLEGLCFLFAYPTLT